MRVRLPDILPALMRGFWNPESVRFPLAGVVGVLWALAFPLPGWAGLAWIAPALLFFGTLGLSAAGAFRFGYVAGLYPRGDAQLYVNRGFGTAGPPSRVFSPPEITRLVLVAA